MIKELTVQDFLLGALLSAQDGLKRNSIDELVRLSDLCRRFPREQWPEELKRFRFHRPRGRMRSRQADLDRFFSDPNHMAAEFARDRIEELRQRPRDKSARFGRYKITKSDGSKSTIYSEAVSWAIEYVNSSFRKSHSPRRANSDTVMELLRRGRGRYPRPGHPDDLSGDDF
jgi:hypothetical protein